MELQPDSTFFFAISRIPAGSDVYIFNNHIAYPKELAAYCRTLGMDQVNYIPLAFEELPKEELLRILSNAPYIIGVDRFVRLLKQPPYAAPLRSRPTPRCQDHCREAHGIPALRLCRAAQHRGHPAERSTCTLAYRSAFTHTAARDRHRCGQCHRHPASGYDPHSRQSGGNCRAGQYSCSAHT